ncbi:MAG: isoprenylcysteine carboxylmethyltransferase family protein [Chloroflexi bacterium]|nr:isoprenylcysteine carboxylmethyltransferase family protein [Chloroflexota bacterium]
MSNLNSLQTGTHQLNQAGINRLIQIVVSTVLIGALMFLSAGRIDWMSAWIFLVLSMMVFLKAGFYVVRKNPDVVNERGKGAEGAKTWDRILTSVYAVFLFAMYIVAGIDAGRFQWSIMPVTVQVMGGIGFVLGMLWMYWAMLSNTFLSQVVRIQTERGHTTVTSGPYRFVRHPMYVGILVSYGSTPLLLGSWLALIPYAIMGALLVVRTALEDRTLQKELPGYAEYAQHVRYRLLPYVW